MDKLLMSVRDGVNTFVYGSPLVCCETCGAAVRPHRAVWRGQRSYCSADHEHADLDTGVFFAAAVASRATDDAELRELDLVRS